jgi:hypothetical protein
VLPQIAVSDRFPNAFQPFRVISSEIVR